METQYPDTEAQAAGEREACAPGASIADVLRLLSGGASGEIVMALGEGPLRTMALTEAVSGYTSRTVYRYSAKLSELNVIERKEEPGVPSKVVLSLSDPCGRRLYELVDSFAKAYITRLPSGRIGAHGWALLGLLAEMWELDVVDALSCEALSASDLARTRVGFSYHQVIRRAGQFATAGLLQDMGGHGRRRAYALTDRARRAMGLVAGLGRWRHQHIVREPEEGMKASEMATVLCAALPLVRLPDHAGKCIELRVAAQEPFGGATNAVWAEVEDDGALHSCVSATSSVDGWARGKLNAWLPAVLDGDPDRLQVGGEEELIGACLTQLHAALWTAGSGPENG